MATQKPKEEHLKFLDDLYQKGAFRPTVHLSEAFGISRKESAAAVAYWRRVNLVKLQAEEVE